jgi:hypothetical protein
VRVSLERNASASTTITKLNAFDCPGRYVVHEVDAFLYTQVADPVQAAQVGSNVHYVLYCIINLLSMHSGATTPPSVDWSTKGQLIERPLAHRSPPARLQPALNLEWALGGEWDSFRLVPRA